MLSTSLLAPGSARHRHQVSAMCVIWTPKACSSANFSADKIFSAGITSIPDGMLRSFWYVASFTCATRSAMWRNFLMWMKGDERNQKYLHWKYYEFSHFFLHFSCSAACLVAYLNGAVQTIHTHLGKIVFTINVVPKSTRQLEVQAGSALLAVHRSPQTKVSSSLHLMPLQNTSRTASEKKKTQHFFILHNKPHFFHPLFIVSFSPLQRRNFANS